jgi:hypothetical protein
MSQRAKILYDQLSPKAQERLRKDKTLEIEPVGTQDGTEAVGKYLRQERLYPFRSLSVGNSFIVPLRSKRKVQTLRNLSSLRGRELGRKFRCILHEEHKLIEIVRTR